MRMGPSEASHHQNSAKCQTVGFADPAAHGGIVRAYAYPPDGSRIATASGDKPIRVWDVESILRIAEPAAKGK